MATFIDRFSAWAPTGQQIETLVDTAVSDLDLTYDGSDKFAGDLYKLGFIPEGAPRPEDSGLVQPLSKILRQLSQGGGAKAINIDEVFFFANTSLHIVPFLHNT